MKRALITGIYGQDGFYLTKMLLNKGYQVYGFVEKIIVTDALYSSNDVIIYECSINDHLLVRKLIKEIQPNECYHFAAQSFVSFDWKNDLDTWATNFTATQVLLAALHEFVPQCRFYFAGSSEMFGNVDLFPQDEMTRFNPRTAYGISKLACYYLVKKYRQYHGMYACTGISYNHESPRRSQLFVTRKITMGVARIFLRIEKVLYLGNLDSVRDWGYAPEYVEAMWLMLNNNIGPDDYVIATGHVHSVRDFLQEAFGVVGYDYQKYIKIMPEFLRPVEKIPLVGNPSKIKEKLGWVARQQFKNIVEEMVMNDIALTKDVGSNMLYGQAKNQIS